MILNGGCMRPELNTREYRTKIFREWAQRVTQNPDEYCIKHRVDRGTNVDAGLYRLVDNEWYQIEYLERWYFVADDISDASFNALD